MKKINVAKDYSVFPGGRFPADGPFSAQEFRDNFLLPPLIADQTLEIELDGTRGYGSSFLEEAFGGLARLGIPCQKLLSNIELISKNASLKEEITTYIKQASQPAKYA